jgi:hypothetical protein
MAFTIQGEGAEGDSKQAPKGDLLVQVCSVTSSCQAYTIAFVHSERV